MKRLMSAIFLFVSLSGESQDYEVKVTEVTVWVKATDRSGKPFTGLTQADFEVYEDGKKMPATCFEEVLYPAATFTQPPQTAQSQTADESASPLKRVVLIVDLYNTYQAEYLYIKPKIQDFLKQISPHWETMLVATIPGSVEISVPFTTDVKLLETKLDQISANSSRNAVVLNRRRTLTNILGRGGLQGVLQDAVRQANEYAMEEKEMARQSLKALEKFEKNLIQYKNDQHLVVLYISGGINPEPGKQYFDLIERRMGNYEAGRDSLGLRESGSDLWSLLRRIVAQLNRHNITFYTINTRGTESPLPDSATEGNRMPRFEDAEYLDDTQQLMAEIADNTGGLYFENSLNFRHGFDLILGDLDHQYMICYKAPPHKKADEFHKIKVESKKSGVKLRHRSGYLD